jgi:hypothetical protein
MCRMADHPDPYAGQGGAYELLPDGTRRLVFRTGLGEVTPDEAAPEPKTTRTKQRAD